MAIMKFVAFPDRTDSIFQQVSKNTDIEVASSGAIGVFYKGKCHITQPNETLHSEEKMDWCSNVAKSGEDKPWITYSLKNKGMSLTGYSLRNGCCYYSCCCTDDNTFIDYDSGCCCRLYSFSLQGSNDNKTWTIIHKVEKDERFRYCEFKTYEFKQTGSFKYIRLVQEKEYPGCPFCMQLNQIELYGQTTDMFSNDEAEDNDESVSIIGKLKRSAEE